MLSITDWAFSWPISVDWEEGGERGSACGACWQFEDGRTEGRGGGGGGRGGVGVREKALKKEKNEKKK